MNHFPPPMPAVTVDASNELLAVLRDRVGVMLKQRTAFAESMIAVGEICFKLRETLPRTVYGERVRQIVNLKTARKAIDRYQESLPVVTVRATSQKAEQNPPTRGPGAVSVWEGSQKAEQNPQTRYPSGTDVGTQAAACQFSPSIGSAQEVLDLLGDTAVPSERDGADLGDGDGADWEEWEEELGEREEHPESEISDFEGESEESGRTENTLRLAGQAPAAKPIKPVTVGPQLTLASLYEQARTVGADLVRAVESDLADDVKARLVADVRKLIDAATDGGAW